MRKQKPLQQPTKPSRRKPFLLLIGLIAASLLLRGDQPKETRS